MNTTEIRKRVKSFRKEFGIKEVSADTLENVFRLQGFTIIEYNPVLNDEDVTTVVHNLGLEEMISHSTGFLYMDAHYRLLFVNEKLSTAERMLVYAHEEGHYYCGHTSSNPVVGHNVTEEHEANEFAHFLLCKTPKEVFIKTIAKHIKQIIIGLIVAGLIIGGCIATKEYHDNLIYEGEYYVTMHGEKYHRKNCVTIQGHEIRRLTKEDIKAGNFEPCSVCQP